MRRPLARPSGVSGDGIRDRILQPSLIQAGFKIKSGPEEAVILCNHCLLPGGLSQRRRWIDTNAGSQFDCFELQGLGESDAFKDALPGFARASKENEAHAFDAMPVESL